MYGVLYTVTRQLLLKKTKNKTEIESMLNDRVNLSLLQKSKLLMHVLKIIITKVTIQFYGSPIFFPLLSAARCCFELANLDLSIDAAY